MGGGAGDERVGGGWKAIERWLVWWLKDGWGLVEVSDGLCGVGKRLLDGWGNGCAMFELSESRADVRPWAAQGRVALRVAPLKRKANGLPSAPVGSRAQIVPKLSKALAPPRARLVEEIGSS